MTTPNRYRIWHFTGKPFPNQSATDGIVEGRTALAALEQFAAGRGLEGYKPSGRKSIIKLGATSFYADLVHEPAHAS